MGDLVYKEENFYYYCWKNSLGIELLVKLEKKLVHSLENNEQLRMLLDEAVENL